MATQNEEQLVLFGENIVESNKNVPNKVVVICVDSFDSS